MYLNRVHHVVYKSADVPKQYVLYWMHQATRVNYNHALNWAIYLANKQQIPLLVLYVITPNYPKANLRSFTFLLEGLQETKAEVEKLGATFVVRIGEAIDHIKALLWDADSIIMDYSYAKHQKENRKKVYDAVQNQGSFQDIYVVESDVIVPTRQASIKEEYGAYTIRPKLMKVFQKYRDFKGLLWLDNTTRIAVASDDTLEDIDALLDRLPIDKSVKPSMFYKGGYQRASQMLYAFLQENIEKFEEMNDPSNDFTSKLSMYLHFGQISSLEVLDRVLLAKEQGRITEAASDAFIEKLLVRRELAINFMHFNSGYDDFYQMTENWAYETMEMHEQDPRPYVYSLDQLENMQTHDPYFNAAMREMVITGYMHNYMRMYWAKKIIEWTSTFVEAYNHIVYLNDKYFLDGRDANSYAGIAWCFGKHDRPWTERQVFGKLRYMNAEGLKRKFHIEEYVLRMELLEKHKGGKL